MKKEILRRVRDVVWELPKDYKDCMRVPGRIYLNEILLDELEDDVLEQIANVACLPGIYKYSIAMPDAHYGYGFCLHPNAKVLTENGFYYRIKDYEKLKDERVEVFNTEDKRLESSDVKKFFKLKPYCKIYKIRTKLGYETIATEDHPFYTPKGMIELKNLKVGDNVAVYPFEGVEYEEPIDETIVDENDIIRCMEELNLSEKRKETILRKLKERGIIPLTYNHKKLPYLLKIIGFIFGDGSMNFIGKRKDGIIHFSSKHLEDLENIRKDIRKIGYTPSKVYETRNCYSFYVNASSLVILLYSLGVPIGNKTLKKYSFPEWIFNCKLWQKRLFLASLFGGELRKPYPRKDRKALFTFPTLEMAKSLDIEEDALKFLKNIAKLLNEFGIESRITKRNSTHKRKDGIETVRYILEINGTSKNLINLWARIGYEYNRERHKLGCYAVAFLKYKEMELNRRKHIAEKVKELFKEGKKPSEIIRLLNINKEDKRFVKDIWNKLKNGKEIKDVRIPLNFPSYEDFIKERKVGDGLVWDEIESIEEVKDIDEVYDFTINHKDHNFIADSFLVSNCIGGVAAFDQKEGIISPGGVGFDINCLTPNSKILTEDNYFIKLDKLKEKLDYNLKIYNLENGEDNSKILLISERYANEEIIRIKTEFGRVLEGSKDHPVLTINGYVPMGMLKEGDKIVVYPFEGVEYEEPIDEIILDESDFNSYNKKIIKYLKDRGLLPLKMNNKNIGVIARLLGFAFGNGSIIKENGDRENIYLIFYGKKDILENIKKDLEKLGLRCLEIYKNYIKITSKSFALFMHKLGMPIGKKINQIPKVPKWIKKAPKWIKANYLAGLFGAEGSKPTLINKYTISSIYLTIVKTEDIENELIEYLNELANILKEFKINAKIHKVKEYDGKVMYRLSIPSNNKELHNFLSKIGYAYYKDEEILLITEYLRRKILIWESIDKNLSKVAQNKIFANNFETLEDFIKKYGVRGGFVLDKIKEIERIPYNSKLYDITIINKEHNFIANNIVVHNCGVRLIKTNLTKDEVKPKIMKLVKTLFRNIPSGLGSKGIIKFSKSVMDDVLEEGARWAVKEGYGWKEDLEVLEENGCMTEADASYVSDKAKERGRVQLGSLGSGNHFLEVQYVQEIYDEEVAKVFGLEENQVVVLVHTGSRGLGHQVCTDYLRVLEKAVRKYNIKIPDRQLACAPFQSEEGQSYYKAMCCAANFAWANRQMITHRVRESFEEVFKRYAEDMEMHILYDVSHNIAKKEEHIIDNKKVKVIVHRKGATRAFYNHEAIPKPYRDVGQPVLLPGDMGTASYVMVGTEVAMRETFGSTAHGAGRKLSRAKALKLWKGKEIKRRLEDEGIVVLSDSKAVLAEEAPDAYKNIDLVADTCEEAGISKKVARLRPMGVIKG
ncbi:RtcB family protein [Methanocaldococcus indicus]|uniref:RtcB family protein n=1 Tax=Methanocaldococcus indicus TaxID=213231 RepID=UPI003C6D0413